MISQAHLRETESADTAKPAKVEYAHLLRSEWLHQKNISHTFSPTRRERLHTKRQTKHNE